MNIVTNDKKLPILYFLLFKKNIKSLVLMHTSECQYLIIHSPLESSKIDVYKHLSRKVNRSNVKGNEISVHDIFHLPNRIGPEDIFLKRRHSLLV